MTLAIAIAANAVLAVALLAALTYVVIVPRGLAPPALSLARVPRRRSFRSATLRPSNRLVAVG